MQHGDLICEFNKRLASDIPISERMGIEITHFDGQSVHFRAPIDGNRNDKRTAFAGSLYSVCALSGWGLVSLLGVQKTLDFSVVIYDASIKYYKPVEKDFSAVGSVVGAEAIDQFVSTFSREGKAKIDVAVKIVENDKLAVQFLGRYAAIPTLKKSSFSDSVMQGRNSADTSSDYNDHSIAIYSQ